MMDVNISTNANAPHYIKLLPSFWVLSANPESCVCPKIDKIEKNCSLNQNHIELKRADINSRCFSTPNKLKWPVYGWTLFKRYEKIIG